MIKNKSRIEFVPPFFFALSFVFVLYRHNIAELSLQYLATPIIVVFVFVIILSRFFRFLFQNRKNASVCTSLFVVLFFSYGDLTALVNRLVQPSWLFLVLISGFFLLFFFFKKTNKKLSLLYRFFWLVSLFAVLFPLITIADHEINHRVRISSKKDYILPEANKKLLKNSMPDIYYIVPDSYSAPSVSEKYFNFDNSEFVSFLEKKGFYVASQATSNYPKTFLSLGSSLNMEYLNYLSVFKNSSDQTVVTPFIQNGNAVRFLKKLGYRFFQMGSWWEITHYNGVADDNFLMEKNGLRNIGEFNRLIVESTMLNPILNVIFPGFTIGDSENDKRTRILYQFEKLPNIVNLPGPKFVFIHIIAPHEPYVFDKNCGFINKNQTQNKSEEENYGNQVLCINRKLKEAINTIINKSVRPPVILLQSDEGAPFLKRRVEPEDSWGKADNNLLREKFPILSGYYLPKVSSSILYSNITPVNSFRVVFNLYFSTKFPLLPDKNYIFSDLNNLYNFRDVTNIILNQTEITNN